MHPDFSENGAPIQIGYRSSNFSTGPPLVRISGIDNWRVVILLEGSVPVRETSWGEIKERYR